MSEILVSTKGMLELLVVPPYVPPQNPDEQVRKCGGARVAKQKALDKVSLRRLIQAAAEQLQGFREIVGGFVWHLNCASWI